MLILITMHTNLILMYGTIKYNNIPSEFNVIKIINQNITMVKSTIIREQK